MNDDVVSITIHGWIRDRSIHPGFSRAHPIYLYQTGKGRGKKRKKKTFRGAWITVLSRALKQTDCCNRRSMPMHMRSCHTRYRRVARHLYMHLWGGRCWPRVLSYFVRPIFQITSPNVPLPRPSLQLQNPAQAVDLGPGRCMPCKPLVLQVPWSCGGSF